MQKELTFRRALALTGSARDVDPFIVNGDPQLNYLLNFDLLPRAPTRHSQSAVERRTTRSLAMGVTTAAACHPCRPRNFSGPVTNLRDTEVRCRRCHDRHIAECTQPSCGRSLICQTTMGAGVHFSRPIGTMESESALSRTILLTSKEWIRAFFNLLANLEA